jgi:hypothetical protein
MSPNEVAGLVGAVLAGAAGTGAVFATHVLPWFKKRDADVNAIKKEVGVGVGSNTMSELVAATAATALRIEDSSHRHGEGITKILEVQATHGETLAAHGVRLDKIEEDHLGLGGSLREFQTAFSAHDKLEMAARKLEAAARKRRQR